MERFKGESKKRENPNYINKILGYVSGWNPSMDKKDGTKSKQKFLEITLTGNKIPTRKEHRGKLTDGSPAFAIPVFRKIPLQKPEGNRKWDYVPYFKETTPAEHAPSIHSLEDTELDERIIETERDEETKHDSDEHQGSETDEPLSPGSEAVVLYNKQPSRTTVPSSGHSDIVSTQGANRIQVKEELKVSGNENNVQSSSSKPCEAEVSLIPLNNTTLRLYIYEMAIPRFTIAKNDKDYNFEDRSYVTLKGIRFVVSDDGSRYSLDVDDIEPGKVTKPKEESIKNIPFQIKTPLSDAYSIEVIQATLKALETKYKMHKVVTQNINEKLLMFIVPPENFCFEPPPITVDKGNNVKDTTKYPRQFSITNMAMYRGRSGETEPYARACITKIATFNKTIGQTSMKEPYATMIIDHYEDARQDDLSVPFVHHVVETTLFGNQVSGVFRMSSVEKTSALLSFSRPGFVIEGKVFRSSERTEKQRKSTKKKSDDPVIEEEGIEIALTDFDERSIYRKWFGDESEIRGHVYKYTMTGTHIEWLTEQHLIRDGLRLSLKDLEVVTHLYYDLDAIWMHPQNITEQLLSVSSMTKTGQFTKAPSRKEKNITSNNKAFAWHAIDECGCIPIIGDDKAGSVEVGFDLLHPEKNATKVFDTILFNKTTIGDVIADNRILNTIPRFSTKSPKQVRFQNMYFIVNLLIKRIQDALEDLNVPTIIGLYSDWLAAFTKRLMEECEIDKLDALNNPIMNRLSKVLETLIVVPFEITVPPLVVEESKEDDTLEALVCDLDENQFDKLEKSTTTTKVQPRKSTQSEHRDKMEEPKPKKTKEPQ